MVSHISQCIALPGVLPAGELERKSAIVSSTTQLHPAPDTPTALAIWLRVGAILASIVIATLAGLGASGKLNTVIAELFAKRTAVAEEHFGLPPALQVRALGDQYLAFAAMPNPETRALSPDPQARWSYFPPDVEAELLADISPDTVVIPVEGPMLGELLYPVSGVDARELLKQGFATSVRLVAGKRCVVPALQALVLYHQNDTLTKILPAIPAWAEWEGVSVSTLQKIYTTSDEDNETFGEVLRAFKRRRINSQNQVMPGLLLATHYGLPSEVKESFLEPTAIRDWMQGNRSTHVYIERAKILRLLYGDSTRAAEILSSTDDVFPHRTRGANAALLAYWGYRLSGDYWGNPGEVWSGQLDNDQHAAAFVESLLSGADMVYTEGLNYSQSEHVLRSQLALWRYLASVVWRCQGNSARFDEAMAMAAQLQGRIETSQTADWVGLAYDEQLYRAKTDVATGLLIQAESNIETASTFRDHELLARAWWNIAGDGARTRQHLTIALTKARNMAYVSAAMDYAILLNDVESAKECLKKAESQAQLCEHWQLIAIAYLVIPDSQQDWARCLAEAEKLARVSKDWSQNATVHRHVSGERDEIVRNLDQAILLAEDSVDLIRCANVYAIINADETETRRCLAKAVVMALDEPTITSSPFVGAAQAYHNLLDDNKAARECLNFATEYAMDAYDWIRCADGYVDILNDLDAAEKALARARDQAAGKSLLALARAYFELLGDRESAREMLAEYEKECESAPDYVKLVEAHLTILGERGRAHRALEKARAVAKLPVEHNDVAAVELLMGKP